MAEYCLHFGCERFEKSISLTVERKRQQNEVKKSEKRI